MSRFKKKSSKGGQAISTASLPDIIFMLLFFFMVTTVMRETTYFVKVKPLPEASEVQKLEKKSAVSYIYIGVPMKTEVYGTEPRIQLNDVIANVGDIQEFIETEIAATPEADRPYRTTSLKVNKETKMGIVTDVKQELREAGSFKINYSTRKEYIKNI